MAILSGVVSFVCVQQVTASFARRRDKRVIAHEMAHLRKGHLEFETALHDTRARLGEMGGLIEQRGQRPGKEDRRRAESA